MTMQPSDLQCEPVRRGRAAAGLAVLVGLGALAAGCGGGSGGPSVASLGTTTTANSSQSASNGSSADRTSNDPTAFSRCMRSHGVPKFPDPSPDGGITFNSSTGLDPNSSQFRAAQRACQKLMPKGRAASPAQQAKMQAQMLRFSACMRSHGVPSFPDPKFSGNSAQLSIKRGAGLDPSSPQFRAAQRACQRYTPGRVAGGPGTGPSVNQSGGGLKGAATAGS
jgi:hypothetical protein